MNYNIMKPFILFSMLFFVLCLAVPLTLASSAADLNFTQWSTTRAEPGLSLTPTFIIKNIQQDPLPAQPGETTDIYMKLDNIGGGVKTSRFMLVVSYPFTVNKATDTSKPYPSIGAGEKITLLYTLDVDKNAVPGYYEAEFRIYLTETSYLPYYFKIKVDDVTSNFDVALHAVAKDGASLALSNTGKNTANAITVRLDPQKDFDLLGPSSYILGNLNAGDYTLLTVLVLPRRNVTIFDILNLSVYIDYTDANGNRRMLVKEIPLIITPQLKKGFAQLYDAVLTETNGETSTNTSTFFKYTIGALLVLIVVLIVYYRRKVRAVKESDEE